MPTVDLRVAERPKTHPTTKQFSRDLRRLDGRDATWKTWFMLALTLSPLIAGWTCMLIAMVNLAF